MPKKMTPPNIQLRKVSELTKAPTNVRANYPEQALKVLQDSIDASGLHNLPTATPEGKVFAGWGRVQAVKNLGMEEMYVVIAEGTSEVDQIVASLAENEARHGLYDDEVRDALKKLKDEYGKGVREMERITGIDKGVISAYLSFYELPESTVQKAIDADLSPYSTQKLRKVVDMIDEEYEQEWGVTKEEIAEAGIDLLTTVQPSGKTIAPGVMNEIAEKARLHRDIKLEIQREIEQAQSVEYRTIAFAIPEDVYKVVMRYARRINRTFQEVTIETLRNNLDEFKSKTANN